MKERGEGTEIPEFRKTDPWDYRAPADSPEILDLPDRKFAWIEGAGDPNGSDFAQAVGALYGFSYAVRMSYRSSDPPPGSGPYTVGLLQGLWDVRRGAEAYDPKAKEMLAWRISIRQPGFLDDSLFERFQKEAWTKAVQKGELDPSWFERLRIGMIDGGRFAQVLHLGPYDSEEESFRHLEASLKAVGLERAAKSHREIYLGDPRRTAPERLKTILRVAIA